MAEFDVIGKPVRRKDAYEKVTGRARYVADLNVPGLLYGKVFHSPVAHARFIKIDTSRAEALPGVVCTVTYEEVPDIPFTSCGHPFPYDTPLDMKILNQHARYVGDAVAGVVAVTPEIAEKALKLIDYEYEPLPVYLTPQEAMAEDAVEIHEGLKGNVAGENFYEIGRVDEAFEKAAYVFEDTVVTPIVTHSQIEPHVSLVEPDPSHNRLIVHVSNQSPYILRERIATALGRPLRDIRVIKGCVGGGFGGKQEPVYEIINCFMAQKCGRPVLLELTREENLAATRTRHKDRFTIRTALDKDHHFIARDIYLVANTGAYSGHGHNVAYAQAAHAGHLYPVPNIRFRGVSVYTNIPVASAMRGYGAPQWDIAMESHIDNMAVRLGIDPSELRSLNMYRPGGLVNMPYMHVVSCALPEMVEAGLKKIGWNEFRKNGHAGCSGKDPVRRGIGMALGTYVQGCYPHSVELSSARVTVFEDGFTTVVSGAAEIGQGTETVFMQIAAEALGFPVEWMHMPDQVDTDITPFDPGAYASRQTYVAGQAVKKAALKCKEDILDWAADKHGYGRHDIDVKRGRLIRTGTGEDLGPVKDVIWEMYYSVPFGRSIEHEVGHCPDDNALTFTAAFARVEVDIKTGRVRVEKLLTMSDSGTIINPQTAMGQLLGGAVMSYGFGLTEQLLIDPKTGRVLNDNLLDYKIPTMADYPDVEGAFFESFEPTSAYGNKSLGEPPNIAPASAIRNAVLDATGVMINELPLTPERVWTALHPADGEA